MAGKKVGSLKSLVILQIAAVGLVQSKKQEKVFSYTVMVQELILRPSRR